jgi:hypothetical protein
MMLLHSSRAGGLEPAQDGNGDLDDGRFADVDGRTRTEVVDRCVPRQGINNACGRRRLEATTGRSADIIEDRPVRLRHIHRHVCRIALLWMDLAPVGCVGVCIVGLAWPWAFAVEVDKVKVDKGFDDFGDGE